MPSVLSHSSTLALLADDAKCFCAITSHTDCALLQDDIDKLVDWSDNWKLAFNIEKCSLCTITRKHNPIICNYKMGGKIVGRVGAQRDPGVLMSDTASFSDHIHAQVNKANKMLGFIHCTISGNKILLPTLRSLYVILVHSQLQYASEIWSQKSVTMIKRIEGVQRRATRLMLPDF